MAGPLVLQQWEAYRLEVVSNDVSDEAVIVARLQSVWAICPTKGKQQLFAHGSPPMLHVASRKNMVELVSWLVKAGCPINLLDPDRNMSTLGAAAYGGARDAVDLLIQLGADFKVGKPPLLIAVEKGLPKLSMHLTGMADALVMSEADRKRCVGVALEYTPPLQAVVDAIGTSQEKWVSWFSGSAEPPLAAIKTLVSAMPTKVNLEVSSQYTAIHLASKNGWTECVQYLCGLAAVDVNLKLRLVKTVSSVDYYGRQTTQTAHDTAHEDYDLTPLDLACKYQKFASVTALASCGRVQCSEKNVRGRIPLWYLIDFETLEWKDEMAFRAVAAKTNKNAIKLLLGPSGYEHVAIRREALFNSRSLPAMVEFGVLSFTDVWHGVQLSDRKLLERLAELGISFQPGTAVDHNVQRLMVLSEMRIAKEVERRLEVLEAKRESELQALATQLQALTDNFRSLEARLCGASRVSQYAMPAESVTKPRAVLQVRGAAAAPDTSFRQKSSL